jgi:O-antigen/teichoic acid export membrane protein
MLMAVVLFKAATVGLGESGFGTYVLATTLMYFVLLLDDFGLNTLITREIARDKTRSRSLLESAMGIKLALLPLGLVFITAVSGWKRYDAVTIRVVWIFCAYGMSASFTQLAFGVFRAHERMEYEALVAVAEKTLSTGLCALALVFGFGIIPFSLLFAGAGAVSLVFALFILHRRIHSFKPAFGRIGGVALFRTAFPYGCSLFITSAYDKLAVLMLYWMRSTEAVGFFGAAQKLLSFTSLIPTVFATAFFPRFAAVASDRRELSRVFTIGLKHLLMIAVPLVPGVLLVSDRLIVLFADSRYLGAASAMRILALPSGILFVNLFWASLYGATGHQRAILLIQIAGLALNAAANALLIPRLSFMGSAWATLITEGFVFLLSAAWAAVHIVRITEWLFLLKICLAAGLMTAFLAVFPSLPLVPAVAAATALYFAALTASGTLRLDQLKSQLAGLK